MIETAERIEELRQLGMSRLRENDPDGAIVAFDEALVSCEDEETRELISINKSFALITLAREGAEVQLLPRILMRRRNPRHVQLAAYNLQFKHRLSGDYAKARFYLRVALDAAEQNEDRTWMPELLIEMGNLCVYDSRPADAIESYETVLSLLADDGGHAFARAFATQNLGYCRIIENDPAGGVDLLHRALTLMTEAGADGFLAETYLDLCLGYFDMENLEEARRWGRLGLELATEERQIRNGHYLLGEIAYKAGEIGEATAHFEYLARFYPDFPELKNLLFAIDLRKMVNFKL